MVTVYDGNEEIIGVAIYCSGEPGYWSGYVHCSNDEIISAWVSSRTRDEVSNSYPIPNTSMMPTDVIYTDDFLYGFNHNRQKDRDFYTPLEVVKEEIRWYYKKIVESRND